MKSSFFSIICLAVFFLASCSSVRVSSDYDKAASFQEYKTYKIVQQDKDFPVGVNELNQRRIETAIKATLTDYDYHFADQTPDLLVSYFVKIDTEQAYNTYTTYYGGRYRGLMVTDVDVREYQEGTLIIDLVDTESKQVVWHGTASGTVSQNMKNVDQKINEAVSAIFKEYAQRTSLAGK